jgi:hypothetical protein
MNIHTNYELWVNLDYNCKLDLWIVHSLLKCIARGFSAFISFSWTNRVLLTAHSLIKVFSSDL